MADWRIYVYKLDGANGVTLVDDDVRASAQPTRELSAPGSVSLTIKPEQDLELRPWRNLIVVELDGSIRGTGIVSDLSDEAEDGALSVTCVGVPGYFDNEPADVDRAYKDVDPAKVILAMYQWAQNRTGFRVGMDFASYEDTGIRIGNPDPPVTRPVKKITAPKIKKIPAEPNKKNYKNYYLKGNKAAQVAARKAARDKYNADMKAWRTERDKIKKANKAEESRYKKERDGYQKAVEDYRQAIDDAIYRVQWWENQTVGQVIEDMSKDVEYKVVPRWSGGLPDHRLTIAKTVGRRLTEQRFVVGENVVESPTVDWEGESYATKVVFLVAGEGAKMIRGEASASRSGGLARTVFIADKSVRSKSAATKRAERALRWRQTMPMVSELKVIDDDNAPFGTFDVGDTVRLVDPGPRWVGKIDMWVKILSITESTDAPVATLTVTRADKGE